MDRAIVMKCPLGLLQKVSCAVGFLVFLLLTKYNWNIIHKVTLKDVRVHRVLLYPEASVSSLKFKFWKFWNTSTFTSWQPEISKNCSKLLHGNVEEINRLKQNNSTGRLAEPDNVLLQRTSDCSWVRKYFNQSMYITKLEQSFPIAYSFLIHNSASQIIRFIRLLYRPHNQYCIAPDLKSGPKFIGIFTNIAQCLGNVHLVSKVREVQWGHKSIIESQMQCYSDLMKVRKKQLEQSKWKYVINLCGKELPLASTHEIVDHLVKLNGSSVINSRSVPITEKGTYRRLEGKTIPYSLPLAKSMTYMSLSYQFIHFLFTNSTATHLYDFFVNNCEIAEEHFYATVYLIPGVPGGHNPRVHRYHFTTDNYFWRTSDWVENNGKQCEGVIVHDICIVGIGDIVRILQATNNGTSALFQNKYLMEHDAVIMDCMEERIVAKNKMEYHRDCKSSTQ